MLDDASRLNSTSVRGVLFADPSTRSTENLLKSWLQWTRGKAGSALAISGVRHSMGSQSLLRDGWVLDTRRMNDVTVDATNQVVRVGAGATWSKIIPVVNRFGLAPAVMQSNNDFTVGGSLSVNCHGWQANRPPIAHTVRSLRLLTADGSILTCSPAENAELFRAVLGGYGLFGVILEAELTLVPNVRYTPRFVSLPTSEYAATYRNLVYATGSRAEMAYGRLSVSPHSFLEEAIIGRFTPEPGTAGEVMPLATAPLASIERAIFRNSADSGWGKALRWWLERDAGPWLADPVTRNSLLNEPAAVFANSTHDTTDVLHEYFVPQHRLWDFVRAAKKIIRRAEVNLLNVTVRDVRGDTRSLLAYARQDVFGLVMLFLQDRSVAGEKRMRNLTRALIDIVLDLDGTFYLPYRLHATDTQLRRAYPSWDALLDLKRRWDPQAAFRNEFYDRYRGR